jgi:hypothetical protein
MKNLYFLLVCFLTFTSCSKDSSPSIDFNGTFIHNIADCDNSNNPEENCSEYIWFNDDSTASIMFGGSDFGISVPYKIINNQIDFYNDNGTITEISFKIIDNKTLERIEDGAIFSKENDE